MEIQQIDGKRLFKVLAVTCVIVGSVPSSTVSHACTVARLVCGDRVLVARNHDWGFQGGLVIVHPRNLNKTAISGLNPASWISRFGSMSFTQYGRGIPFAGMNEVGLTIDLLQLPEARFPVPDVEDSRPTVNVIQWVQYQLDTAETVADVVESLNAVIPLPLLPSIERVHFFVTDATGDAAVVEFLDGRAVVRQRNTASPSQGDLACALSNCTFDDSIAASDDQIRQNFSLRRFRLAKEATKRWEPSVQPLDYAFAVLKRVRQSHTQWSLVYDPAERRITFTTTRHPQRRYIDFDDVNLDADVLCIDVQSKHSGSLRPHLRLCDQGTNDALIEQAFDHMAGTGQSPPFILKAAKAIMSRYPSTIQNNPALPK